MKHILKRYFFVLLWISLNQGGLLSQSEAISIGSLYTLSSLVLDEDRSIAVFTPQGYEENVERYHVLYLLDAEWNFHFVTGLIDKMIASGDMLPTIVVGIVNSNRSRDLTPAVHK